MIAPTEIQTIKDPDGNRAFVVIPYAEFMRRFAEAEGLIPHEVVSAAVDGASPMKAWREYLGLTQAERVNLFWTDWFKDSVVMPPGRPGGLGS